MAAVLVGAVEISAMLRYATATTRVTVGVAMVDSVVEDLGEEIRD